MLASTLLYYISRSLGVSKVRLKKVEKKALLLRRSIFAAENIKKNTKITKDKILIKRPKIGIAADEYFKIIGTFTKKNIIKNNPIFRFDLK